MKIEFYAEANENYSPIRVATAIIEHCMNLTNYDSDSIDMEYRFLKEVNEHIDVFLKNFDNKGSDAE